MKRIFKTGQVNIKKAPAGFNVLIRNDAITVTDKPVVFNQLINNGENQVGANGNRYYFYKTFNLQSYPFNNFVINSIMGKFTSEGTTYDKPINYEYEGYYWWNLDGMNVNPTSNYNLIDFINTYWGVHVANENIAMQMAAAYTRHPENGHIDHYQDVGDRTYKPAFNMGWKWIYFSIDTTLHPDYAADTQEIDIVALSNKQMYRLPYGKCKTLTTESPYKVTAQLKKLNLTKTFYSNIVFENNQLLFSNPIDPNTIDTGIVYKTILTSNGHYVTRYQENPEPGTVNVYWNKTNSYCYCQYIYSVLIYRKVGEEGYYLGYSLDSFTGNINVGADYFETYSPSDIPTQYNIWGIV